MAKQPNIYDELKAFGFCVMLPAFLNLGQNLELPLVFSLVGYAIGPKGFKLYDTTTKIFPTLCDVVDMKIHFLSTSHQNSTPILDPPIEVTLPYPIPDIPPKPAHSVSIPTNTKVVQADPEPQANEP